MYRTDFCTLWEKVRVGCFERTALKHVYYLGETDHQPRLDAWDRCSDLVHWEDLGGACGEGDGRGDQDGEHMCTHGCFILMYDKIHYK